MAREHRVLSALLGRGCPRAAARSRSARTRTSCGAPFYVMEHVDGLVLSSRRGRRDARRPTRAPPPGARWRRRSPTLHAARRRRRSAWPTSGGPESLAEPAAAPLDTAVARVEDARAPADRRGRRAVRGAAAGGARDSRSSTATTTSATALVGRRREHPRRPRLGALHGRRPAGRRRPDGRVLERDRRRPPARGCALPGARHGAAGFPTRGELADAVPAGLAGATWPSSASGSRSPTGRSRSSSRGSTDAGSTTPRTARRAERLQPAVSRLAKLARERGWRTSTDWS